MCACAQRSWPGRAGRPPGRVLVRLTFSFGRFVFLLCWAPLGLALPLVCCFTRTPSVSRLLWFPAPGAPGLGAVCRLFCWLSVCSRLVCVSRFAVGCSLVVAAAPPPFCVSRLLLPPLGAFGLFFFFFLFFVFASLFVCAPVVSGFLWFQAPGALGLGAVLCVVFFPLFSSCLSALLALSPILRPPLGRRFLPGGCCPPPPPSPFVSHGLRRFRSVPCWFFFSSFVRPRCLRLSLVSGPGCPGPWRCVLFVLWASRCPALRALSPRLCVSPGRWLLLGGCRPAPPFVSRSFRRRRSVLRFFFFFSCVVRPRCLWLSLVSGPGCPGPQRCALFALLASRFSALRALSPVSCFPAGRWLLPGGCCPPPPPFCVSRFLSLPLGAACRVLCCAVCPWVRCCAALLRVLPPDVVLLCAVLFCCARLVPLLVVPFAPGPCALRRCVLRCSPALCALCCVCFVVARWCAMLFLRSALCCLCAGVLCCAFPVLSAVLVRLHCAVCVVRAVACAWCCGALLCVVLFPLVCCGAVLGLVARGCLLVACLGVGVPVWPRGLPPCGWCGLLWCPASLRRVLWCCAVAWCCVVVLCCRVAVLLVLALPSCGLSCCAVLCCWLVALFFARSWCLRAVVLFSACCAFPVFSALRVAMPCCAGCGALLACVVCCGAVLSRGAVACRAVLCCAVGWLCCVLPDGGVCVLWCLFPPCRHAQKTMIISLCYPAPVSVSVVHVVGEVSLVVRRMIADPGRVVFEKVVLFVVVLACLQRNGGRTRRGWGRDEKGRYMEKKTKQEGASFEA